MQKLPDFTTDTVFIKGPPAATTGENRKERTYSFISRGYSFPEVLSGGQWLQH